jgi:hypothetical protein
MVNLAPERSYAVANIVIVNMVNMPVLLVYVVWPLGDHDYLVEGQGPPDGPSSLTAHVNE